MRYLVRYLAAGEPTSTALDAADAAAAVAAVTATTHGAATCPAGASTRRAAPFELLSVVREDEPTAS